MAHVTLDDLRQLIVSNCMLQVPMETIEDHTSLFSPEGIGLDSLDALQLTVAVENTYGLRIENPEAAREILKTPYTLREWINTHAGKNPSS